MGQSWDAADQLQSELEGSIKKAIETRRPIVTHVNADTTWLIQLPVLSSHDEVEGGRAFYNILIDPWLSGPQSDVASWFSTQWHSIASSVKSIEELEIRLQDIDDLARNVHGRESSYDGLSSREAPFIDLVVISHEFTDHCHEATLKEIHPSVPVVATEKAASLIGSWGHFQTVISTPSFAPGTDWRQTSVDPLPPWLGVSRVVTPGNKLYYHSAVMIAFTLNGHTSEDYANGENDEAEAVIYTPHGIQAKDLGGVAQATPPIRTLALMHGLHDVGIIPTFQLNLGAHNALKAQRAVKAAYWVGTHDEVKKGGGLIGPLLRRSKLTLQEAVEREAEERGESGDLEGVNFAELSSGESMLLL